MAKDNKRKLFYITRRSDTTKKYRVLVRAISIVAGLLICAITFNIFSPGNFAGFFTQSISATFGSVPKLFNTLEEFAILLGISLALLPAFKMRYWNLGAEGQVLMGALCAGIVSRFISPYIPTVLTFILMIIFGILGGMIWAVIPALFKAKYNTNETLFTLMMNYLAMGLIVFLTFVWDPEHGQFAGLVEGMFSRPKAMSYLPYLISLIVVLILMVGIWGYIKFSKHGYELTVVGESQRTARYVGMNVPKITIRTVMLSGALCGIIGWLLVSGQTSSVSSSMVGGRGFTGVLIAWLGHFEPFEMCLMAFLVAFITRGSNQSAIQYHINSSFSKISVAIFFFIILASEFFLNYKINFNFKKKEKEMNCKEASK